jgi:hypothetical protein
MRLLNGRNGRWIQEPFFTRSNSLQEGHKTIPFLPNAGSKLVIKEALRSGHLHLPVRGQRDVGASRIQEGEQGCGRHQNSSTILRRACGSIVHVL